MRETELFGQALGLAAPWFVAQCAFQAVQQRLDRHLDFVRGGTFPCPTCGRPDCSAYNTEAKTWRHLNFFEHVTYLHARLPRIVCPGCGVKTVTVPWARAGSGFTLLFEAVVLTLAHQMPVRVVARLVGEHDTR